MLDKIVKLTRMYIIPQRDPNDPVHFCEVHKTEGCAHVDGFLCHMPTCDIRKNFKEEQAAADLLKKD